MRRASPPRDLNEPHSLPPSTDVEMNLCQPTSERLLCVTAIQMLAGRDYVPRLPDCNNKPRIGTAADRAGEQTRRSCEILATTNSGPHFPHQIASGNPGRRATSRPSDYPEV